MQFRAARHTNRLEAITQFYTSGLGLEVLGSFEDHEGYNGVFIGKRGLPWHLEFTSSEEEATHTPDADDLLVLYPDTQAEVDAIEQRLKAASIPIVPAQNPYWNRNGLHVLDPDGFGVVISPQRTVA